MGDIAEDMINFEMFGGGEDRYTNRRDVAHRKRGKRYKLTEFTVAQKVKGVMFYLHDKGFKDAKEAHLVIKKYCAENQIELPEKKSIIVACCKIQEDFKSFLLYVNKQRHGKNNIPSASVH